MVQNKEEEEIKEPPMSSKEVLQSLKRIKDICDILDRECEENAVEQCIKVYCLYKNYSIYKKTATAKQTTLNDYFQKYTLYQSVLIEVFSLQTYCKLECNCKYIIK